MPSAEQPNPPFKIRTHPHLYEINTWSWLEQLSKKLGRCIQLHEVPDSEWDALAARGFDIVWLMGVWQRSVISRQIALNDPANFPQFDRALPGWKPNDVIGSPYAVANYAPDPRIGTWESLDRVREKLHARKIALFLDFVGNHTALDHPWISDHPEFYVQGSADEFRKEPALFYRAEAKSGTRFLALARDPYFPPWKDVAQLNHFDSGMRAAQLADLRTIAEHCDGVRCDMAMLHLNSIFAWIWGSRLKGAATPATEFWTDAHAAVPGLTLLAEAYWGTEPRLLELGFSYAYDKELYDAVRDGRIDGVHSCLAGDTAQQSRHARFLENHDEPRRASIFGDDHLQAVGSLMGSLPGMRFYYQGEIEGRRNHLPITLRVPADEPPDPASAAFFENLLQITKDAVFHDGQWQMIETVNDGDSTAWNLIVYEWRSANSWKLIAVNLAGGASQGRVKLGGRADATKNYIFNDVLNDVKYPRSGEELANVGLFVRREAHGAHLFDITTA